MNTDTISSLKTPNLRVERWNQETFETSEKEWQALLSRSTCDPLFLSWHWLSAWWSTWGKQKGDKLEILAAYYEDNLVGIAPLYVYQSHILSFFPVKRLAFLGTRFKQEAGILSEHLQFIVDSKYECPIVNSFLDFIETDIAWDEFVTENIDKQTNTFNLLELKFQGCLTRELEQVSTYLINCDDSFKNYLSTLGKNTRLKLFNRRTLFESSDNYLQCVEPEKIEGVFNTINKYHQTRFGTTVFTDKNIGFLTSFFKKLPDCDRSLRYSSLLVSGENHISSIFNIAIDDRLYNIQLGYSEDFHKKISLGLLHLGYCIEMAMSDDSIRMLDLLKGGGKSSDYKSRMTEANSMEISMQYVRPSRLKVIYWTHDRLLRQLKSTFKRMLDNIRNL